MTLAADETIQPINPEHFPMETNMHGPTHDPSVRRSPSPTEERRRIQAAGRPDKSLFLADEEKLKRKQPKAAVSSAEESDSANELIHELISKLDSQNARLIERYARKEFLPELTGLVHKGANSLYTTLSVIYESGWAIRNAPEASQIALLAGIDEDLKPDKIFNGLLAATWPVPRGGNRKSVQTGYSRYAQAMEGAWSRDVLPPDFVKALKEGGGVAGFAEVTRNDRKAKKAPTSSDRSVPKSARQKAKAAVRAGGAATRNSKSGAHAKIEFTATAEEVFLREAGWVVLIAKKEEPGGAGEVRYCAHRPKSERYKPHEVISEMIRAIS